MMMEASTIFSSSVHPPAWRFLTNSPRRNRDLSPRCETNYRAQAGREGRWLIARGLIRLHLALTLTAYRVGSRFRSNEAKAVVEAKQSHSRRCDDQRVLAASHISRENWESRQGAGSSSPGGPSGSKRQVTRGGPPEPS